MTPAATATRNATDLPIAPLLAQRWSPRGFDADHVINSDELACIVEAARWAPSAGNTQPWAFAAARLGTEAFAAIHATLAGFNQVWTPAASAHATAQVEHLGLNAHQMGGFDADALRTALDLPEGVRPWWSSPWAATTTPTRSRPRCASGTPRPAAACRWPRCCSSRSECRRGRLECWA